MERRASPAGPRTAVRRGVVAALLGAAVLLGGAGVVGLTGSGPVGRSLARPAPRPAVAAPVTAVPPADLPGVATGSTPLSAGAGRGGRSAREDVTGPRAAGRSLHRGVTSTGAVTSTGTARSGAAATSSGAASSGGAATSAGARVPASAPSAVPQQPAAVTTARAQDADHDLRQDADHHSHADREAGSSGSSGSGPDGDDEPGHD